MRPLILLAALVAAALLPSAAAQAQSPGGDGAERYFLGIPPSWSEASRHAAPGAEVVVYVPQGQTARDWTDMLTVQVFRGMTALPAESFYERTRRAYQETCADARAGTMQTGLSNDYPAAFWVLGCGRHGAAGMGETSFFRLVQGDRGLYLAQRAWRTAPYGADEAPPVSPDQQQEAMRLLGSFGVCDPSVAGHPCPATASGR